MGRTMIHDDMHDGPIGQDTALVTAHAERMISIVYADQPVARDGRPRYGLT